MAVPLGVAVIGGLWRRIREVALADVAVLLRGVDASVVEGIERVLLEADFGPVAYTLLEDLEQRLRRGELRTEEDVRRWLVNRVASMLGEPGGLERLNFGDGSGPAVFLLVGVNGVGKTTVAAKLAHLLLQRGRSVLLAATDTYRAAAAEQLAIWARRLSVPCVTGQAGGDPAAVAFNAIDAAVAQGIDTIVVDTAGRLHTRSDLVEELKKVRRVVGRKRAGAPHETLLVVDATTGQNSVVQAATFTEAVSVTGMIVTKLDGTAKGGSVVAVRNQLGLPIRFLGVGERVQDLEPFAPERFAEQLVGA